MKSHNLVFVGNSNIVTVVRDILGLSGARIPPFKKMYLVDDNKTLHGKQIDGMEVIGCFAELAALRKSYQLSHALITISENHMAVRETYYQHCHAMGFILPRILHPSSIISSTAHLGEGVVICAGVVVGPQASVDDNSVVFTGSTIDHHTQIGASCIIGPGVHIAGNVLILNKVVVGVGAVLLPRVEVGEMAVVGAGAVVTKNVAAGKTVIGVPARIMEQNQRLKLENEPIG